MKYRDYYISPKYSQGDGVYYGSVSGVPEIEMIEAANIDDFERLFHDAIDTYLAEKKGHNSQKRLRWLYVVIPLAAVIVIALLTCPDKSKHVDVLKDKIGSIGAFGHVFSVPKKTLEKRLNESEEFQELKDWF